MGRGAVEEEEGVVEARDRAVPEAEIGSTAVDGGGGGGDGEEDAVERERRRESGGRLDGGESGSGREVELVKVEDERDGEQGGEGEEEVSDAGSRGGKRNYGHFPAVFHTVYTVIALFWGNENLNGDFLQINKSSKFNIGN